MNTQRGSALLWILMIVAIVGILIVPFMDKLKNAELRRQSLEMDGLALQVRAHLQTRIDCERLPQNLTCPLGGLPQHDCSQNNFALYDFKGNKLIPDGGGVIGGSLRARACCSEGNLRVEVRQQAGAHGKLDRLTTRASRWTNIYDSVASPCDYYNKDHTFHTPDGYKIAMAPVLPTFGDLVSVLAGASQECPSYMGEFPMAPAEYYGEAAGEARCPDGYEVRSGGGACNTLSISPVYVSQKHLHPTGFGRTSVPSPDGQGWRAGCCAYVPSSAQPENLLLAPIFLSNKIAAVCQRKGT